MISHFEAGNNPGSFQEELFSDTERVQNYFDGLNERGAQHGTTHRKLAQMIETIAQKYGNTRVFLESPLLMLPDGDDIGIGMGDVTGTIRGFVMGEIPVLDESFNQTDSQEGMLMIVTVALNNGEPSKGHKAWERFLPAGVLASIDDKTHLLLVPLSEGLRATKLDSVSNDFETVDDFLRISETAPKPFNHMDFVNRIELITRGMSTFNPVIDGARMEAMRTELIEMNSQCPYRGQVIELTSSFFQTPDPERPGRFMVSSGTVSGILRKFVYAAYQLDNKLKGAVQAVIYPPETAAKVRNEVITPQQADKMFGTIFAPLDIEHHLEVKK